MFVRGVAGGGDYYDYSNILYRRIDTDAQQNDDEL